MDLALLIARLLLAAVFATAALAKLQDLSGSRRSVAEFGVPARLAAALGTLLPVAELTVAAALLADPTAAWGALGALSLLLLFAAAIAWNLGRGKAPDCHCFGQLHSSPASLSTVARNLGLAAVAAFAAVQLADPWLTGSFAGVGLIALAAAAPAALRRGSASSVDRDGLAVGAPAPVFRLPALRGLSVTLDSLAALGRPVLLVFSDPSCGPCLALAPLVARWQRQHSGELTIAVLERGYRDPGQASEDPHGRRNILFQEDGDVADAYRAHGTPTAVLVGLDGAIASPPAGGAGEIEALVARSVNGHRPEPATLGRPLIRRELLERGAVAWAATGALLAAPAGAFARNRSRRQCSGDLHACGEVCCGPNQDCINNRCRCTQRRFPDKCGRECVDTRVDELHCGGCYRPPPMDPAPGDPPPMDPAPRRRRRLRRRPQATPCVAGEMCVDGRCVAGDDSLCDRTAGTVCCDGEETGLNFDDTNCGECGVRCDSGEDPGCCWGKCVDHFHDPKHCGECGKRCPADEVCSKGECKRGCRGGQKRCAYRGGGESCYDPDTEGCCQGQVVSIQSSDDHCGQCGQTCRGPKFTCKNGHCVCAPGYEGCWFSP